MAIFVLAAYVDHQNRELHRQQQRESASTRLSVVRARLEGLVTANIQLVRGLVSVVANEPGMDQQRFQALAGSLIDGRSELRSVAAAPGMVVRLMYPLPGNESAIGLDYLTHPEQRAAAIEARDSGRLVLAGPLDLVQGGTGLVGRFPVYVETGGERRFWGLIAAVVDLPLLYERAGLLDDQHGLSIAIRGKDGKGADGERFFGPDFTAGQDPVVADVLLPEGRWQMQAIPSGGWSAEPPNSIWIMLLFACAAVFIVLPIGVMSALYAERKSHLEMLTARETRLTQLSRRLQLALDASSVGVWELDVATGELVWDARMRELYGVPGLDDVGDYDRWSNLLLPDDLPGAEAELRRAVETGERYLSQFRVQLPDGTIRTIRAIGAAYQDAGGGQKLLGVNWDATEDVARTLDLIHAKGQAEARAQELEQAQARIEHTSLHDALTGLPNRRYLDVFLNDLFAAPGKRGAALLHIDLDRFKHINDTLGHAAGDAMLVHVAKAMKAIVRKNDFVARIGGDEFVVVCVGSRPDRTARAIAQQLVEAMRQPAHYNGHECRFGVSVGVAIARMHGGTARDLLIEADIALYQAKNQGRNRFEFYTDRLQQELVRIKTIADEILAGIEKNQFVPYYQPQYDAVTQRIVGMEALARWNHPVRGVLAPDAFLGVAEEINALPDIDSAILDHVVSDIAAWRLRGLTVPRISVNVSLRRLLDDRLVARFAELDLPPGSISVELVESIYLDDVDEAVAKNIEALRRLGVSLEIDDFGTGYASIVSLVKLRPDYLKIDRRRVAPVLDGQGPRALVKSIVDIGKSLNIGIVAEGVETMTHAAALRDLGCDILQGYAFSRPLSPSAAGDLLEGERERRVA